MNTKFKKIMILCAVAVFIVIIAIWSMKSENRTDVFSRAVNTITKPFKSAVTFVMNKCDHFSEHFSEFDALKAENEQLKARIAEYEDSYLDYVKDLDENERLRRLLDLTENNPSFKYAEAVIIAWNGSSWRSCFTISGGTESGIKAGDCCIDEYGNIIGVVTETSANSSVVTTIVDTTSSIGARVAETRECAIACGKFELFKDRNLALSYLPDDCEFVAGNSVITNGTSGACPSGLKIGIVKEVCKNETGLYDYAVITPAADFDNIETVFVVISY